MLNTILLSESHAIPRTASLVNLPTNFYAWAVLDSLVDSFDAGGRSLSEPKVALLRPRSLARDLSIRFGVYILVCFDFLVHNSGLSLFGCPNVFVGNRVLITKIVSGRSKDNNQKAPQRQVKKKTVSGM